MRVRTHQLLPSFSGGSGLRARDVIATAALAFLLTSCSTPPVGADRVSTRRAYEQVGKNVLSTGQPSAETTWLVHRYGLAQLAKKHPDAAVRQLHAKALATHDRDLLFALSELSCAAGDQIASSVQPWDPRDARDFYLGAAVYSYLFLFEDDAAAHHPAAFDRRFRHACDLYNYGLGLALKERRATNGVVRLEGGKRCLPVGEIELEFNHEHFPWSLDLFDRFLLADEFRVRGLSVRVREPGVGAPLLAVSKEIKELRLSRTAPATAFLRLRGSLADCAAGKAVGTLELYSIFDKGSVTIDDLTVPLEADLTAPRAYTLNQASAWNLGRLQFLSPTKARKSQLVQAEPYLPGRVPVVFVHGTFSSPAWWSEMFNTLEADPQIRSRCQNWMFLYSSSNPVLLSSVELREAITNLVHKLDPEGKDTALQQMVVIGHSQGGLLAKLTATDTSNRLWSAISNKRVEELNASEKEKALVRRFFFVEPLSEVKRVVFISTPHRGSYQATDFVRSLIRKIIATPAWMAREGASLIHLSKQIELPKQLHGIRQFTSMDNMSPNNPQLGALAEIPVAPGIKAHSIIPVKPGFKDYHTGNDGVVKYTSAHVDYVDSELVVRWIHSCQDQPAVIEEVRRILHEHLDSLPIQIKPPTAK